MTGRGLKVGVTVADTAQSPHALLWSSGVHQNAVFLLMLLQRLPQVSLAALVTLSDGAGAHLLAEMFGFPHLPQTQALEQLDVLVELGQRGAADAMLRFRERGGRLVSYMAGNVMAMNFEAVANHAGHGEIMSQSGFDAVWITPQHWRMNRGYAALTRTPHVERAPHIWSPACLSRSIEALNADPFWRPPEPGAGARIGVFDPNVNVVKTFHLPLLVCEQAYRRRPDLIGRVLLFSAAQLMPNLHFQEFCAATDLDRDRKLFAEARHPSPAMLGAHIDAVVTHQWENALNYLYWDVLYLGWPLIHNSPEIADVGYYYPSFDPKAGGEVLCEALQTHADRRERDRPGVEAALWRFDIDNSAVQRAYAGLLEKVMA